MANTTYITEDKDRWDLIASKAYGDATLFSQIIQANPNTKIYDVFPKGIELNIPIVDPPEVEQSNLPPWKRNL